MVKNKFLISLLTLVVATLPALGSDLKGKVVDGSTGEEVVGATVKLGEGMLALTDLDGNFEFKGLKDGKYPLLIKMISYDDLSRMVTLPEEGDLGTLMLNPSSVGLGEVTVSAQRRLKGDAATVANIREALVVATGVSGDAIARTPDRDAGEVAKRLSGISIISDKFLVARGLSQRYNNIWLNNAPVPSSEADTRAFSFDIIPAGQIENMTVYKSPAPEIPADFTGGFVKITTRESPDIVPFNLNLALGYNTDATFKEFLSAKGGGIDFLGFDDGTRDLKGGIKGNWDNNDPAFVDAMTKAGFNNDWRIRTSHAWPDMKLTSSWGKEWNIGNFDRLSLNASVNYGRTTTRYMNMQNSRYGIYNIKDDKPEYLYNYSDDRYQTSVRWGALLNLTWSRGEGRVSFRNIFNQLGQDRLTFRDGWQNISSRYDQEKTEYLYTSRTAYCGQFAGLHPLGGGKLEWEAAATFADKNQPDRRIINRQQNDLYGDKHYGEMQVDQNDISREFSKLNEYMLSAQANYRKKLNVFGLEPELKVGAYMQWRKRDFHQRQFYYRFNSQAFDSSFGYGDPVDDILALDNLGSDKLFIYDDTDNRDSYTGNEMQWAAYAAVNVPVGKVNIYGGARFEQNRMTLTSYTHIHGTEKEDRKYNSANVFPSVNVIWGLPGDQQIRAAYGMSTNRPEFREVSPSVYYDFELFSDIKGNPDLKTAYIQNVDARWEWYPGNDASISAGVFFKHFKHPIENTFLDAGGSYTYTFENAKSAYVMGIEFDASRRFDFIGLPWLVANVNAAFIKSHVNFDKGSLEHNRSMQGQSPYIINAGIYYRPLKGRFNCGAIYNRIGKRIVGIGRSDMSVGGSINNDIPDMYEMPRNALDIVATWNATPWLELRVNAKDVLNEKVEFCQFPRYELSDGTTEKRKQTTRSFSPGTTFTISASIKL